jgi:hypothetical protein
MESDEELRVVSFLNSFFSRRKSQFCFKVMPKQELGEKNFLLLFLN